MRLSLLLTALLLPLTADAAPQKMTVAHLLAVKWIKQTTVAPSGKWAAFTLQKNDRETNKRSSDLYLVHLRSGGLRRLTTHDGADHSPAFSPDSRTVAFVSSRGGSPQIWLISVDGGEARQLTSLSTGASRPVWSPGGKLIAFSSRVYPDCKDDACNKQRLEARKNSKVKARVFDGLLIRHWNHWRGERRSHVFVVPADGESAPRDLTPGPHDAPPISLGGDPDYAISPDEKTLAYVANTDQVVATSTNNDVFEVPIAGGKPTRVSTGKGNDNSPRYSQDGRFLAFLSMKRAGYESDRPRVMVRDRRTSTVSEWSKGYTGHPISLLWSPDSTMLYFNAPHHGHLELFSVTPGGVTRLTTGLYAKYPAIVGNARTLVFTNEAAHRPPEVFRMGTDGKGLRALTRLNHWLPKKLGWQKAEHVWFEGAQGDKIHAVLIKPPGFRKGRRYPAMVMIHGGPQGMTGDSFHPRWNLQTFASRGYVVFGINFHGSVGFGQAFTDSIRGDWGGKPYRDILKGTEHLAAMRFVRPKKICAAGASYGGYMINWIATHSTRFNCLISHAGLFNMESKYGSTEELWFPEWDMKGTPWTNRALYRKFSPHSHAENLSTPTLVIHGQKDYRVPVEQGFQMYTALQRQGVPSRLLYFPDEDHFVQKPQNIELWWRTMWDWLGRYLK